MYAHQIWENSHVSDTLLVLYACHDMGKWLIFKVICVSLIEWNQNKILKLHVHTMVLHVSGQIVKLL